MARRKKDASELLFAISVLLCVVYIARNGASTESFDSLATIVKYTIGGAILIFISIFLVIRYRKNKIKREINKLSNKPRNIATNKSYHSENYQDPYLGVIKQNKVNHGVGSSSCIAEKESKWSIELIRALEWKCFETLCANVFNEKGLKAVLSSSGADGGIDISLYKDSYSQEKVFAIVQCKAWPVKKIGVSLVRELFGVKAAEKVPLSIFVTSGDYTDDAIKFASGKNLNLITGKSLLRLINKLSTDVQENLLKEATFGDYTTPSCPKCDIKMILRETRKGVNAGNKFWGCRSYPKCKNTFKVKKA